VTYWYGNGDVDADLTSLNLLLEQAGRGARASEYGRSVAVLVGVDKVNGLVDGVDVQTDEDRTEDFFRVAFHMGFDVGDNGRTDLSTQSIFIPIVSSDTPTQLPLGYLEGF
jgi:hypothetical protein